MERAIIFGLGNDFLKHIEEIEKRYNIIAYTDNNAECVPKEIRNKYILPKDISNYQFDVIIICSTLYFREIKKQLVKMNFQLKNKIISLQQVYPGELKMCECCGNLVRYMPLPDLYFAMQKKYGYKCGQIEFLNCSEYYCPLCIISDRGRLILSFLKKYQLSNKAERVLQIAPEEGVDSWIRENCSKCQYETTDLYMLDVSFKSDIQNMDMVGDNTYDLLICSHVFEHVKDDILAMKELRRILKNDGLGIFLVPIDLDLKVVDEEWGLSEEENWRRFGQEDHCRQYNKAGFIQRLKGSGFIVHCLGIDFFGEEIFYRNGLTETSCLYIVTKQQGAFERKIGEMSYE